MTEKLSVLARIDERTKAQGGVMEAHIKEDSERFERVFAYLGKRFDKIDEKLDTLWDENNQRKGAFTASRLMAAGVWAAIVLLIGYFLPGRN